jgi:hypothetical protein
MRVRTLICTFENGQIGDNTACVEIFESLIDGFRLKSSWTIGTYVEDDVVTVRNNAQVAVSWIDGTCISQHGTISLYKNVTNLL